MSSRSNMSEGACASLKATILARVRGRVETHILLNFLQTGARRADGREWRLRRYCIRGRDTPGIYLSVRRATETRGATGAYCRTCTDPASAAEPRGGRLGELGTRADAAARDSLVRGH